MLTQGNQLLIPLAFILGFIGYRLRGSAIFPNLGNTLRRILFWAIPVGVMVVLTTKLWWAALASIPLAWLGVAPGYFGGEFALDKPENRNIRNYALLGLRGAWITAPIFAASLVAKHFGLLEHSIGLFAVIAGALFPLYYFAGMKLDKVKLPLLTYYPEWGEAFLGGAVLAGTII